MMEWWNNGILGFKNGIYPDFGLSFTACIEKRFHPFEPIIPTFQYSIIPRHRSSV
jgi:hypothetical protein